MQSLCPHPNAVYRSIYHAMTSMVTKEGLLAPLRGINVVALGAGPAHALYFSTYEATKQFINGNQTKYNPISHGRSSYHCRNYCMYCKLENKLDVIVTLQIPMLVIKHVYEICIEAIRQCSKSCKDFFCQSN